MASLFLTAELLGRQRSAITSLAFAAAIMIGISPRILGDAAFQLSFLAMAGLIFIAPPLMSLGRKAVNAVLGEAGIAVSLANIITDSFSVTLGALIGVWPLVAYYFGVIALVAPLTTFLALPALPGIIITGALAGGLGLIVLPAAQVIAWLAWLFLSYLLLVVSGFAALPLSSIEVNSVDATLVWAYYLALAAAIWLNSHRQKLAALMPRATNSVSRLPKKWVIPPLMVAAMLVSFTAATMPDDNLHVSFLDVGQGDAILIQTPSHQDILIDGGASPQAISLGLSSKMPFWDRTIDLVILTHPDADHVSGLVEVLRRYKVKQVLYPDLDAESSVYDEWLRLLKQKDIKYTIARAGQQIDLGEVVIKVLNPPKPRLAGTKSDIDNNGVVLRLAMGRVSFLFTADIRWEAEFELIAHRTDLTSTILKVAHHGSDTSTSPAFLAVVNPQRGVISAGVDNRFGHPSEEILERLTEKLGSANIYRTDKHGNIEFTTDGERLWVEVERID